MASSSRFILSAAHGRDAPEYRCSHRLSLGVAGDDLDISSRLSQGAVAPSDGAHERFATALAYSACGSLFIVGCNDGTLLVWDCDTLALCTGIAAHDGPVSCICPPHAAFAGHERILASAGADFSVRLWDVDTAELLYSIVVPSFPLSVAISPLGRTPAGPRNAGARGRCLAVVLCADNGPLLFDTATQAALTLSPFGAAPFAAAAFDSAPAQQYNIDPLASANQRGGKRARKNAAGGNANRNSAVIGTSVCWAELPQSAHGADATRSCFLFIGTERGTVDKYAVSLTPCPVCAAAASAPIEACSLHPAHDPCVVSVRFIISTFVVDGSPVAVKSLVVKTGKQLQSAPGCDPLVPPLPDDCIVYILSTDDGTAGFLLERQQQQLPAAASGSAAPEPSASSTSGMELEPPQQPHGSGIPSFWIIDPAFTIPTHSVCGSAGAEIVMAAHRLNQLTVSVWSREHASAAEHKGDTSASLQAALETAVQSLAGSYRELPASSLSLPAPESPLDRIMGLCHHPVQSHVMVATRRGRLYLYSRVKRQSWTAFAPFLKTEELMSNLQYAFDPVRDAAAAGYTPLDVSATVSSASSSSVGDPRSLLLPLPSLPPGPVAAAGAAVSAAGEPFRVHLPHAPAPARYLDSLDVVDEGEVVDLLGNDDGRPVGRRMPLCAPARPTAPSAAAAAAAAAVAPLDRAMFVAVGSHVPFCLPLDREEAPAAAASTPLPAGDVPVLFTSTAFLRRGRPGVSPVTGISGGSLSAVPESPPSAGAQQKPSVGPASLPRRDAGSALQQYLRDGLRGIVSITQRDLPIYWYGN